MVWELCFDPHCLIDSMVPLVNSTENTNLEINLNDEDLDSIKLPLKLFYNSGYSEMEITEGSYVKDHIGLCKKFT